MAQNYASKRAGFESRDIPIIVLQDGKSARRTGEDEWADRPGPCLLISQPIPTAHELLGGRVVTKKPAKAILHLTSAETGLAHPYCANRKNCCVPVIGLVTKYCPLTPTGAGRLVVQTGERRFVVD